MERIKDIVFATNNAHKLEEVRQIVGERFRVLSLKEINCHDDIPETADTLEGNALIKARWIKERYGFDCFADDTGLMVDALGGAPGVHTARYAGDDCNSEKNVSKMLSELEGVEERNAHFSTVIALIYEGQEVVMEGREVETEALATIRFLSPMAMTLLLQRCLLMKKMQYLIEDVPCRNSWLS